MKQANDLLPALERHWGYREYRPLQAEAVQAVLEGRDSVLVAPTGGGKSLTYQLPAAASDRLAIVVSPLIALMKDQVDGLKACGVDAAAYNSSLNGSERRAVLDRLQSGQLRLLYCSPERLVGDSDYGFVDRLARAGVSYLAIDEAHCISHWGHDFRPEYRKLAELRERLGRISVHALTATATPRVREDIVTQLGLIDPSILVGPVDRANLTYRVKRRHRLKDQLTKILARHSDSGGIIYCISRRETEEVAAHLIGAGIKAAAYHAGLPTETRRERQEAFLNEDIDVVVATVAFGMGIDRSNVRFVIHAGSPRTIEHYQQESGRAGRDGAEAECVLIYSPGDFVTWQRLLERDGEASDEAVHALRQVQRYASGARCRHRALSEHFGQDYPGETCNDACDWCLGELRPVEDSTTVAQKILSCIVRCEQRFGAGHVINVLRGSDNERVRSLGHQQLSTYGLLKEHSHAKLRALIEQLCDLGMAIVEGDKYPILQVSQEGWNVLRGQMELQLYQQKEPSRSKSRRRGGVSSLPAGLETDPELFQILREVRGKIAREEDLKPYMVAHDRSLAELAAVKPTTTAALLGVHGFGPAKVERFGDRLLDAVREHLQTPSG